MFTTFHSASPGGTGRDDAAPASRPKRSQVHRACDWCKLMRIKCDSHRPCRNCHQAGRDCASSRENQFRNIAAAVKEVERLRALVRNFEHTKTPESPARRSPADQPPKTSLVESYADRPSASRNTVRVDSNLYGVASLPFFLTRMGQFLQNTRRRPRLDVSKYTGSAHRPPSLSRDRLASAHYLPRAQEEQFLELFWQTHYFGYPILNEGQFRREYKALWADSKPGAPRKASPLADIVLALCVQLGSFTMGHIGSSKDSTPSERAYPSLAGYQYYQRCQEAIDQTIESPSLTTVQCYIFSIVYLYEAGLLNRAQIIAGKAIMMAMILGLPHEPMSSDPEPQKEVARRTWWSLYILDAKLSMENGRPPLVSHSHSTCHLPSDSAEVALWLGPHYTFDGTCPTWLGFQTQALRLLDLVRTARSVFYTSYDAIVHENGYEAFVANSSAREQCAVLLTEQMKAITAWARAIPEGYLVPRRGGQPYSTDRAPFDLSPDIIIHCSRQRILLELQYHQHCMTLCQPFICFASDLEASTPESDTRAAACLNHAITLTSMVHQALSSSELLCGVYHAIRWQKNALFIMIGYAYTFPISHAATAVRKAIDMAIDNLDVYRDIVPEAGPVAAVARILAEDARAPVAELLTDSTWSSASASSTSPAGATAAATSVSAGDSKNLDAAAARPAYGSTPAQPDLAMLTTVASGSPLDVDALFNFAFPPEQGDPGVDWDAALQWDTTATGEEPNTEL